MRRQLVLKNDTACPLILKELQQFAGNGCYSHETKLDPYSVKLDFPATFYQDRNRDSLRSSEVVIFAGGEEAEESLCPETFLEFVKIIFEFQDPDHLVVYGIRPRLTDIRRFSGFGFLGREYSGRTMELILRTRILRVDNGVSNSL